MKVCPRGLPKTRGRFQHKIVFTAGRRKRNAIETRALELGIATNAETILTDKERITQSYRPFRMQTINEGNRLNMQPIDAGMNIPEQHAQ